MKFTPGTDAVASLKTNFHLVSMVEDFTLQEQLTQPKAMKVICELCMDQQEAQSRCMDCPFFLCANCQAIHQRIPGMAGHVTMALDTLRSGSASLRSKVQDKPLCERHRGEKKRFYCLTCQQLICRDCTVVEHRESTHKFTTVDEAAARGKENTRELIQKVEENLKVFEEVSTELTEMNTELEKSMNLARQAVTYQDAKERRKIAKREANISNDISKRQNIHEELMYRAGIKITGETKPYKLPTVEDVNQQIYSKTIEQKLGNLDSSLTEFGKIIESLLKSHDTLEDLRSNLTSAAAQEIEDDKSKVATNLDQLLKSIELRKSTIEEVGKMTSDDVLHMRQTLEKASEMLKSSSNVDFLNLHLVINGHLRVLLVQSPHRLPLGYSKMVFKSSEDTALGELILGGGLTWKFAREINTDYRITSMATSSNDEILISTSRNCPQVITTSTGAQRYINQRYYGKDCF